MSHDPQSGIEQGSRGPRFSLVHLIVIVVVVLLIVGLIIPATQAAREQARRAQCANNLKQLGMALQSYHSAFNIFPPSSVWRSPKDWKMLDTSQVNGGNTQWLGENWIVLIAPMIEQGPLARTFDSSKPMTDSTSNLGTWGKDPEDAIPWSYGNRGGRGVRAAVVLCPSDTYNVNLFNGAASRLTDKMADGWARGNYGANAGLGLMTTLPSVKTAAADPVRWRDDLLCGVMGANTSLRIPEIRDGLSNTILLGELRAGVTPADPRGVWTMGNAPGSALWGHGYAGDDNGPNAKSRGDGICSCSDVQAAVGGAAKLAQLGMPCDDRNRPNWQQTARSMHPGGVNVCLADGSVHFISDDVELGTDGNPPTLGVWDKLNLSNDGEPLELPPGLRPFPRRPRSSTPR